MRQEFLVSTDWLAARLGDPNIRIVDCRYAFDHDGHDDYVAGHIPGALYLNWDTELSDHDHPVASMIAPPEQVRAAMQRFGVSDDTTIVAYDQEGGHFAARVWLVLARYGHGTQLRILDGGWTAWTQESRPTTQAVPEVAPSASFTLDPAIYQPDLVASAEEVLAASHDQRAKLLDVRRHSEFTGAEVRAIHGGRVPGATWHFWQDNLNWDSDRRFRPPAALAERATAADISDDTLVITYCQGGVRAAHAAVALMLAGHDKIKVYDGSWAEWGNRDDLPIETGDVIS